MAIYYLNLSKEVQKLSFNYLYCSLTTQNISGNDFIPQICFILQLKTFWTLKYHENRVKIPTKNYLFVHKLKNCEYFSAFYTMSIRVFPSITRKKMVCHHATFFVIKPKLSENMVKFTHTCYTYMEEIWSPLHSRWILILVNPISYYRFIIKIFYSKWITSYSKYFRKSCLYYTVRSAQFIPPSILNTLSLTTKYV